MYISKKEFNGIGRVKKIEINTQKLEKIEQKITRASPNIISASEKSVRR